MRLEIRSRGGDEPVAQVHGVWYRDKGQGKSKEGEIKKEVRCKVAVVGHAIKEYGLAKGGGGGGVEEVREDTWSRVTEAMEGVGFEGEEGAKAGGSKEIKAYKRRILISNVLEKKLKFYIFSCLKFLF